MLAQNNEGLDGISADGVDTEVSTTIPELSEVQGGINLFSVKPTVFSLSHQLNLEPLQQSKLEELLKEKAQADFEAWQLFSKSATFNADDTEYYQQRYEEQMVNNSSEYQNALKNTLSVDQLEQYQRYEQKQAELIVMQKRSMLINTLKRVGLSDYQKEDVKRLSAEAYALPKQIKLGMAGSPYANLQARIDFDKLNQIKALFTDEQLKSINL
ncbi:hypothetical protein [Pseudoalteromonas aurantia]|uniref:Lipase helper protein n=1 Tax=Pseudoalteromonas aurantia 208 TaxID=1314867 RepID=A0ABR9E5Y8_9GAMM|nr:hypothetical protein [Pseudoalteromonas aurantia]MBE0366406.1 hypothetical protein [Pseudoalteromonas aurantia 208]